MNIVYIMMSNSSRIILFLYHIIVFDYSLVTNNTEYYYTVYDDYAWVGTNERETHNARPRELSRRFIPDRR